MRAHNHSWSAPAAPLSLLDLVSLAAGDSRRPMDFTILLRFRETLAPAALRKGAASACRRFPVTGSCVRDGYWMPLSESPSFFSVHSVGCEEEARASIENFSREPWDLEHRAPVGQHVLVHTEENRTDLVSRFHHAAADGVSAAQWLSHQIAVARGREPALVERNGFEKLLLQTPNARVSGNRRKDDGRSQPLWRRGCLSSSIRFWKTVCFDTEPMRREACRDGSFTYNDILATCALETLRRWNEEHGVDSHEGVPGLWLPVNIRKSPFSGFGNGSSRIRVNASWDANRPILEKCNSFRREVLAAKRSGEWAVPSNRLFRRMPATFLKVMMSWYFRRPWMNAGTAPFSHVERLGDESDEMLGNIEMIEIVGPLHARHPFGIYGATHRGRTWLTFTYDPAQLSAADVSRLAALYADELHQARSALSGRGASPIFLLRSLRAS